MDHGCMTVRVTTIVTDVGQTIAIVAGDVVETYAMKTIVARPIAQTDTTHTIVNIMMTAMRMMKSSGKS